MTLSISNIFEFLVAPLPVPVAKSEATAHPFYTNGHLGVDLLYLPPGYSFPLHTHPGDHLLLVVKGNGTVTFDGQTHETKPGDLYMVDASVEHAVGAGPDGHWILAFGAPHTPVDSEHRMQVVGEEAPEVKSGSAGELTINVQIDGKKLMSVLDKELVRQLRLQTGRRFPSPKKEAA